MNKTRRMLAGLGAMTPAFIAADHVQARTVEPAAIAPVRSGAPALALDQEALKRARCSGSLRPRSCALPATAFASLRPRPRLSPNPAGARASRAIRL